MALSPMTGMVQNDTAEEKNTEFAEANEESEDIFALPEVKEPVKYEYDETSELEGMRTINQKAFRTDDGKTALITAQDPLHYISEDGSWDNIDLNIKATIDGWEVTENLYQVSFAAEAANGVTVMVHPNVDPIVTGLNPMVMTLDESGTAPMPYNAGPAADEISVGGNVIRYPVADGFDLDYSVFETNVKQNLVVRERPVLDENIAWFGLTEQMLLPLGYGVFVGDDAVNEEIVQTQSDLTIRNLETGELLVTIPMPVVMDSSDEVAPYHGTYFIQVFDNVVILTTAVEADWILSEDRVFPIGIDPSIRISSGTGGYCYTYYSNCYVGSYRYIYRYYSRNYYQQWSKYTWSASNAPPTGASIDKVVMKNYINYIRSGTSYSNNVKIKVMEDCGTKSRYSWTIPTATCSGAYSNFISSSSYGSTTSRKMISSIWNSQSSGMSSYSIGYGWRTSNICTSSTSCASTSNTGLNYIVNAVNNGGTLGIGATYTQSSYAYFYTYNYGSYNSYVEVTYSGGSDTKAPSDTFVPYSGLTTYKEGARTFFTTLADATGVDTTSSGMPHLYYSVNNASYTGVKATLVASCASSPMHTCKVKATTGDISTGDYVRYYWAYQDTAASPNFATNPTGGTGSPSSASAPSSPYHFFVDDVANAGNDMKMTIHIDDRSAYTSAVRKYFDQQMTYYEGPEEYIFEFDTSSCGTGSNSCFYTGSASYFYQYSYWKMSWQNNPTASYQYTSNNGGQLMKMEARDGGYLTMTANNGPGMNLAFVYDSSMNKWAMVGIDGDSSTAGNQNGIEDPLAGGTSAVKKSTYGYTAGYLVDIPTGITGSFGKFDWKAQYSSSTANWMCVGNNGFYYFIRSTSSSPSCTSSYYTAYYQNYWYSGFAIGTGYYAKQSSTSTQVTYKVGKIAPSPDTYAPDIDYNALRDSHSRDRTFSFSIADAGDPPSGLNVSTSAGVGPTLYYRITAADGTVGSWVSTALSPNKARSSCVLGACDWTYTLEDIERGATVEYYATATDVSPATSGVNTNTTSTHSFEVGDPNKVFIVEWHDLGYTTSYQCTFQALFYDVTNEIEFKYDTGCKATYDYATVGYQDHTRTKGVKLRQALGYLNGGNPNTVNYRISTDSSSHAWETFDAGLTELPTYDTAIAGTSNGRPYATQCARNGNNYWSTYKAACNANIDMPDTFSFDYFGKTFDGADSKNRVHLSRFGNVYFKDDGSTALERSLSTWYSNMPNMPATGLNMPGNIAPWWGFYSSYYCYDNTAIDCSVRTRMIPFEGKGTDVTSDITQPTTWALIDSPIRVSPTSDYLSIGDDLTIEEGVVVQVASGKGLSFDGSCSNFNATGSSGSHILFEGQQGGTWKGLAFTAACPTGTDDRHIMSYVDFANTTDAAIAAGSRHGASPSSNGNVGNFTMDEVTFTNVGTAFKHGSGAGTVVSMSNFDINDASDACFDFAEDSVVTLTEGEMDDCNSDGNSWGGAVLNYPGSTSGSLIMENVDITNSRVNLINVDFENVWISNVTGATSSAQSGIGLGSSGSGANSVVWVYNLDADGYASANIDAMSAIDLDTVDLGSATMTMTPGGSTSTSAGPAGKSATFTDVTTGDMTLYRMAPEMNDIDVGALTIGGNAPNAIDALHGINWDTEGISVSGCGYTITADNVETDWVSGSCSSSAAPNTITLSDVDATYTGTMNALYARNSAIIIGDGSWTMPSSYDNLAKASANGRIVLINVDDQANGDCDGSGNCVVDSSSSGAVYFGDLATVKVFKLLGDGTKEYKSGHTVQASVVDSGSALFIVGTHKTDSNGEASVWVISGNDDGDTYTDHNLRAWGPSGQNETSVTDSWYPGSFGVGDSIELRLEPAPVGLNGSNMDCNYLKTHPEANLGYDSATETYTWEGKVTLSGDLTIDSCTIVMRTSFAVDSDGVNNPVLKISSGGTMILESTSTSTGTLKAVSPTYPLNLDLDGGTLHLDGGQARDVSGGINVDSGTFKAENNAIVYGMASQPASQATVYVNGGTIDWDDSTIMNAGQTGIGMMFEGAGGDVDNIVVKNAAVGLYSKNAMPQVNGFTMTDNDVGVDVYGGMSLPTIYRSTLLSGQATGWTTYEIDMTGYLGSDDYLQVGLNSIYGGGNAHPTYNYFTSKYYMIYDRLNIELTDDAGNSWNVTKATDTGYYDGSMGGAAGAPTWHCNYYGYSYTQWYDYNYMYYLVNYGGYTSGGSNYDYPSNFGFRWEDTDNTPSYYYPMHYWGYSFTSYHTGGNSAFVPPEGFNGLWGSYNVCIDYAYSYYNNPGDGSRLAFPAVDISSNNITGVKMYVDVLHNRADMYQDRLEVVARTGDDPSAFGNYQRESGTPAFNDGVITGAENGLEIGGSWAAGEFTNVTVTSPTNSGMEITGSSAASIDGLTVTGGNYGVLVGAAGSGSVDMSNMDLSNSAQAGIYYVKDLGGDFEGTITGSSGAGIKLGKSTSKDLSWDSMTLGTNAVGIETAGSGELTLTNSDFANTKDFVISGTANVAFVEGTVDPMTVEVTGNGIFERMRELSINVQASSSDVSGAKVVLKNADGEVTGSGVTDSNGDTSGLTYVTQVVDAAGHVTLPTNGYTAVTVAKVGSYYYSSPSNNAADFRYSFDTLTLSDSSGNSHNMDLTDTIDARVCYSYTSSSYTLLASCASGLSTGATRTYSNGMKEYGYWGATPRAMENQSIMVDVGYWYIDGNTDNSYNNSELLVTGAYDYYHAMRLISTSPYGARLYAHNTEWTAVNLNDDGEMQGIYIGFNGWNDIVPDIQDSTISGLATVVTTFGYKSTFGNYVWKSDFFKFQNNTASHFRQTDNTGAAQNWDMCLNAGAHGTMIDNNTMRNCGVGIFLTRTGFSYAHPQSTHWGADDAVITNNEYIDTSHIDVWFSLNSYSDDVLIQDNVFRGSTATSYGVYTQDRTTTGITIDGNTFLNSDEAIYMRGALDWEITDNTIAGKGDASFAGIYVRDGYGLIDGNTLTDADGGILVDGIRFGYTATVTNNDVSTSPGRTAPTAVGIWAEDCGSSGVVSGGNTVTVMENAMVTDGCDLEDTGSVLNAIGGNGGAVHTVLQNANTFSPMNVNIKEGDTVRWRSNEYYNNSGSGEPHDVTSNATDSGGQPLWTSGVMNLGSTWSKTFNTAGTYEYHDSLHPSIYGTVTVSQGSSSGVTSVGFSVAGSADDVTLDGTVISGFGTAIEQYGGSMTLEGDALLSGGNFGAYAEDTDVVVDGARLVGGSTGSGIYVTGDSSMDATDMDTSGLYGLNTDGVDFRWNGGDSDAGTALMASSGAEGSAENVTWADATTQIDAGSYVTVTSVGNTVDASKLIVDSTAVIHEGNLLNMNATWKGAAAEDIGVMIKSTDGAQAAYVSPAYRAPYVAADGDLSEWYGNTLNPSDDAMPGVMSSDDSGEDFMATWDANNLYLALTGVDMGSADLQIYLDSSTGGDTTGQSWYVSHSLPFAADYVFWAEDGSSSSASGLKVNGFSGWVDAACTALSSHIGYSGDTDTEIAIPWDCIGQPTDVVRMIVVVQDESTGETLSVHPDQSTSAGAVGQTFNEEMTIMMGHSDLAAGDDLRNHLLVFRSYVGSNVASAAKQYDLQVKVDAVCEEDWGDVNDIDMSTNKWIDVDIKRACPEISNLIDITVNEDSGAYTLTLTDKADDVQDEESSLTWTVADDADPSKSPSMLLDSALSGQTMTMTPDHDQFGTYTFHFGVEDSHGLTDSQTITFEVINVNDAPIICNTERTDCMPVITDDGAGNLNVLDEGFGSVSQVLGSSANTSGSYVVDMASNDMANEQPQVYTWGASIKGADVSVDPYWVQTKYSSVYAMFSDITRLYQGAWDEIDMTGSPSDHPTTTVTYTLPTLTNVTMLTYLLAQNGCGSVWYQEYMNADGEKVAAVRSDDGCDSTIDESGNVYSGLNYTDFWQTAYGVDTTSFTDTWNDIFPSGYSEVSGYNPCPAFSVGVLNNELTITENTANELGGDCTIVLTLEDDGGYCANAFLGRTADVKASCVSWTWLVDYDVVHPVYGPMTVTGCYNLFLGLASFTPPYYPDGTPTGMTEAICLGYSWVGENTDAQDFEFNFSVTPVNDAPEVLDWNANDGTTVSSDSGVTPTYPWKLQMNEDEEDASALRWDLSAMKHDNDHVDEDLVWSVVPTSTCNYENYFTITVDGDDLVFDLIKDAATNVPDHEIDYLNDNGIHQIPPLAGDWCPITVYLHDSETAPSYVPNYGMSTADYQQGEDSVEIQVKIVNQEENVPDYYLQSGFDFNEVSNIMPKTYVPTTVKIHHAGDEGPYNYDHMLQVTFHSNGYNNDDPTGVEYVSLGTQYLTPPAYGEYIPVSDDVFITSTTTEVWVEVDVLTCVDATCDMTKSPADRYFGYSYPQAHRMVGNDGTPGDMWSAPGNTGWANVNADGTASAVKLTNNRRPMLEDESWCNNVMTTNEVGRDCTGSHNPPMADGSNQKVIGANSTLPTVVRLIGTADVPSFAPSLIAISAAGLFVSALVMQSRREEEEQELEEMSIVVDDTAVSPVIATILMVAITVVLSGVIYVWASSLADTSAKGVPRLTFSLDSSQAGGGEDAHYRISIQSSQVDLATQAIDVLVQYVDADGNNVAEVYNLADPSVYGFSTVNSDSMVTFADSVDINNGITKSSFDTGDFIFIRSSDADGTLIENIDVTITYNPPNGPGAVLRAWDNL
ncbi:MAG: type IV pilin [Candidatus Poseidoniaceae archaeon]|nr:type IV pilin [Candidatus Poseidoniaceae archaeon]